MGAITRNSILQWAESIDNTVRKLFPGIDLTSAGWTIDLGMTAAVLINVLCGLWLGSAVHLAKFPFSRSSVVLLNGDGFWMAGNQERHHFSCVFCRIKPHHLLVKVLSCCRR